METSEAINGVEGSSLPIQPQVQSCSFFAIMWKIYGWNTYIYKQLFTHYDSQQVKSTKD